MDSYKFFLNKFTGCAQALCDSDNPAGASVKRLEKSVRRSSAFAAECLKICNQNVCGIFATVVGGYDLNQRIHCCEKLNELTGLQ
ncbi:hypothetical protein D918_02412, partial [Trichuris suis]